MPALHRMKSDSNSVSGIFELNYLPSSNALISYGLAKQYRSTKYHLNRKKKRRLKVIFWQLLTRKYKAVCVSLGPAYQGSGQIHVWFLKWIGFLQR